MNISLWIISSVAIVSLISLIGILAIAINPEKLKKVLLYSFILLRIMGGF